MIKIDALGLACPMPVIQTKKAIRNIEENGTIETLVDNEASMGNLLKMAKEMKLESYSEKIEDHKYKVTIIKGKKEKISEKIEEEVITRAKKMVVAISSDKMGTGIDELGDVLMKGFIYTLTEMDIMPTTILLYNGGAKLSVEGAPTLVDLKTLEEAGVEILTCGTCLNYYGIDKILAVGEVTNMYTVVERLQQADKIIKP